MKKKMGTLAVLTAACVLSGCSVAGTAENLLSPPMLSAEQSEIYEALRKELGKEIKLKFPKAGDYRSAFIVANIDDEPTNEALVIYESPSGGNVRINVLDKNENGWFSAYDHAGAGAEVEDVKICRLGGSSALNILVGYSTVNRNEKQLKAYIYKDGVLVNTYDDIYFAAEVMDLDGDGRSEIEIITAPTENKPAKVKMVTADENNILFVQDEIGLDDGVSEIASIVRGYAASGRPALFIDGVRGSSGLSTEIVYCIGGSLRNPVALSEDSIKATIHPKGYSPADADGDGITEIPTISPFPGYESVSSGSEVLNLTTWNIFENYMIVPKMSGFYNRSAGYFYMIPSRWEGVVTVKADSYTGEYVFFRYDGSLNSSDTELMRIAAVDSLNESAYLENGYFTVESRSGICYMIKISSDINEPLVPTQAEVKNNFYLI